MNLTLTLNKKVIRFILLLAITLLFFIAIGQLTEPTKAEFNTQEKITGSITVADNNSEKSDKMKTQVSEENNDKEEQ